MLWTIGLGFVLGVAVAVFGVVKLIALSNRLAGKTAGRPARFYVNVHVLNTDEIVEHAVKEKAGKACETGQSVLSRSTLLLHLVACCRPQDRTLSRWHSHRQGSRGGRVKGGSKGRGR